MAKSEAANVKDTATEAGKNVAATARDEAATVAADAKQQAGNLWSSVTSEVQSQAGSQQQKIASSVHAFSHELNGMASGSSESGPLTDLAQQAADKGSEIAQWLENREPRDVLREVQDFGRRRPVAFLALCGLAGVVVGRLTRGAVAANTSIDSPSSNYSRTTPRELETPTNQPRPAASILEETAPAYDDSRAADDLGYAGSPEYGIDPGVRSGGVR